MSSSDPQFPVPGPADPWRKPDTGAAPGGAPEPGPVPGAYPSGPAYPPEPTYGSAPAPGYGSAPAPGYGVAPAPGGYAPGYGYGYGYAPGGYYPKNSYAVWSLVLGILSLVSCGFLTGVPAIIVGNNAKKAAAVGEADNPGMATAGVVLGWIGTALSAAGLLIYLFFVVFAVVMSATTPST
ncbi:DUF4190 domain-containing protein [Cellulomonas fimi]|uniref:DUF4190 domain-containing protein n=1 Tax=Cellulomonas fimi TaxID=1708 RepID=UPI00234CFE15|nr:DUF4190 domain-containing protein [Cellulomonas fimi]MDC7122407.1 DUF4190 domain-containing protein [Cellulomonas fimi]